MRVMGTTIGRTCKALYGWVEADRKRGPILAEVFLTHNIVNNRAPTLSIQFATAV